MNTFVKNISFDMRTRAEVFVADLEIFRLTEMIT